MIGIFDSGVGGISILRDIQRLLPTADIVYFGDTAHVPYGTKTTEEIQQLSLAALQRLLPFHPSLLVVACNTATSVAINQLREAHPNVPIVGVVPVVKTLAERTVTKRVAILATQATFDSSGYADLSNRYAGGLQVLELALPEWVEFVERGEFNGPRVGASLEAVAQRIRDFGADSVAFGCTHFSFLKPQFTKVMIDALVLDSAPAVARHVVRVLTHNKALPDSNEQGTITWLSSSDPERFKKTAQQLLRLLV